MKLTRGAPLLSRAHVSPSFHALNKETGLARLRMSFYQQIPTPAPAKQKEMCALFTDYCESVSYCNVLRQAYLVPCPFYDITPLLSSPGRTVGRTLLLTPFQHMYLYHVVAQICPGVPYEGVQRPRCSVCIAVLPTHSPASLYPSLSESTWYPPQPLLHHSLTRFGGMSQYCRFRHYTAVVSQQYHHYC